MIKKIFSTAFHSSESEIKKTSKPDFKVIIICIVVALSLTLAKYLGDYQFFLTFLKNWGFTSVAIHFDKLTSHNSNAQLYRLIYWASNLIFFYCLPPFILIKFVFKEKFADYGLSLKGAFKDYKIYLVLLGVVIPLALFVSRTQSFQDHYPFYGVSKGESFYPNLFIWEIIYFLQFFALEFFFRGFMLHGTKQRFGYYSVFVMTIPYCMIHFGKPLPETLAAIIAGIVLGTLSLKNRSIWLGVAIHYSVAITMDLCSLWQKGLLVGLLTGP